jgi:hypothetical protein
MDNGINIVKNGCTFESSIEGQRNSNENSNVNFQRNRKINPKVHMKVQNTQRHNMGEVFMYENGTMRPIEIVLRKRDRGQRRMMEGVNLRYTVSTFVNVTMYPSTIIIC